MLLRSVLHLLNQDLLVADDVDALANLFEALACGVVDGNVLFCGFNLIDACQDVEQIVVEVQADAIEGGMSSRLSSKFRPMPSRVALYVGSTKK